MIPPGMTGPRTAMTVRQLDNRSNLLALPRGAELGGKNSKLTPGTGGVSLGV